MSDRAARFDRLYAADGDPWRFRSSTYERDKYRATLAALPRARYCRGIEAGCSIGELTKLLADRCDSVTGIDVSEIALAAARATNADLPGVTFLKAELPAEWPEGVADLVVLSEVLYFLSAAEIQSLAAKVALALSPDGHCVLVNYLGPTDESLSGPQSAELFIAGLEKSGRRISTSTTTQAGYRLDVVIAA